MEGIHQAMPQIHLQVFEEIMQKLQHEMRALSIKASVRTLSGEATVGEGGFEAAFRGVEKDCILYVGQLVLLNVPVERWIINPYEHSFLDSPGKGMCLPTHSGKIVQFGMMTWGVGMAMNWGRYSKMFPWPFPTGPRFPYACLITLKCIALLPVNYSNFLLMLSLSFSATRRLLMVLPHLKVDLDAISPQMLMKLPKTLSKR